ncbi:ShlB/FhaC/HecB family hemolysin secretion/activation protein [Simkania sp.]|uniref:ShlB/FhaC/HecB family hemolysin secretion/activation protein n=1 Tax=Simkania sp. TaxID=34094 RepID=UPI003B5294C4
MRLNNTAFKQLLPSSLLIILTLFGLWCTSLEASSISDTIYTGKDSESDSSHKLEAIVLVPRKENLLSEKKLKDVEGVEILDLDIPGGASGLAQKLQKIYQQNPLSIELIDEIKQTVATYFKDNGRPVVFVKAPDQELTSGKLQLIVTESQVGNVSVTGNKYFSNNCLRDQIKVNSGEPLDEKELIRNLNLINRNPFRHADMMYLPGTEPGITDITFHIADRRPYRFYAGIENTGVESTGRNRLFAGVNFGNMFWRGDVFGYQYTTSDDFHRFQAHTIQYTAGLPWGHLLNIFGGYSSVNTKLAVFAEGVLLADGSTRVVERSIKGDGYSGQASARYIIPFFLGRYLIHDLIIGFDWKRMNNRTIYGGPIPIAGDNATLTQFVLGYAGDYQRDSFRLDFETNLFYSPGTWLPDQTNEDYRSLTPKAKMNYVYWRGALIYLQKLPLDFSLRIRGEGQISSQNLLPSEEYGLGGYNTVRGYDERVVNKENIFLLSTEFRSPPLPVISKKWRKATDALQILVFLDYAVGRNKFSFFDSGTSEPFPKQTQWLMGAGPGLRYTLDPYLTARLDWGFKIHKNSVIGKQSQVAHFSVTASY